MVISSPFGRTPAMKGDYSRPGVMPGRYLKQNRFAFCMLGFMRLEGVSREATTYAGDALFRILDLNSDAA